VGVLEGIPAGLPLSAERVNAELKRRMGGYGRGARMKIEADQIEWLAGCAPARRSAPPSRCWCGTAIGSTGQDVMAPEGNAPGASGAARSRVRAPGTPISPARFKVRPPGRAGHPGAASARETVGAGRVRRGVQGVAEQFGMEVGSHVRGIGWRGDPIPSPIPQPLNAASDASPVRCLDPEADAR